MTPSVPVWIIVIFKDDRLILDNVTLQTIATDYIQHSSLQTQRPSCRDNESHCGWKKESVSVFVPGEVCGKDAVQTPVFAACLRSRGL